MEKTEWIERLRGCIRDARTKRPAAAEADLTPLGRRQRPIHASVLVEFQGQAREALRERFLLGAKYDPDPVFVITGDDAFVSSITTIYPDDKILMGRGNHFFPLHEDEYTSFVAATKEPLEFQYHVHWWSIFDEPETLDVDWGSRNRVRIDPTARYVNHRIGFLWGPHHGQEWWSLWKIDGDDMQLVAQDYGTKRF